MSDFASDTAIEAVAENHYRAVLREGWRVGEVPNGGYVLAIAGRALRDALPHKDPMSVNAFYLAPTTLGPIDLFVEVLRSGGSTSFAEVRMVQAGELKVKVTAAFTTLNALTGESWSAQDAPTIPPPEAGQRLPEKRIEFRDSVDITLVSGAEVFTQRVTNGSGVFSGWARLRDGSEPDVISLLLFADAFPPPVFTLYGLVGWVPTVELSVQVRAHPAPGPLQGRLVSKHLTRGVIEEDGEFWDSQGQLVAISRQTAKFRLPKAKA